MNYLRMKFDGGTKAMTTNLFNYATKELSQDAFLMWLIDNLNCDEEDVKKASKNLLDEFGIKNDQITKIEVKPQYKNIDVVVYFYQGDEEKPSQALFLEDKTSSGEHNQLIKYNESIKTIQAEELKEKANIRKIYYKTFIISAEENGRIREANEEEDVIWDIYDIEKITSIWKDIQANNLILKDYTDHIADIDKNLKNEDKPLDNNLNCWIGFFKNKIIPKLEKENYVCKWDNYHNHYIYLVVRPKGYDEEGYPYYELRSTECADNYFRALVQIYGVEDKFEETGKNDIKEHIKKSIAGNTEGWFITKNYKQQVGQTETIKNVVTIKDFEDTLINSLEEFRTIIKSYQWNN